MSRILVTGASGFIGSACLPDLLARGYEVHAVLSPTREVPRDLTGLEGTEWDRVDLLDANAIASLIERAQASHLLHLAWYAPGSWDAAENWPWVDASLDLLREFATAGGRRAVVTGTSAEYDYHRGDGVCSEDETPLDPQTIYGKSKHALFERAAPLLAQTSAGLAWARIFSLYGPREEPTRLVPSVARALLQEKPALCTAGLHKRDFLHVDDAARALGLLIDGDLVGPVNVGSGDAIEVRAVVEQVAAETGHEELVQYGVLPTREVDPPLLVADTQRIREELGFQPSIALQEGIAESVAWWRGEM